MINIKKYIELYKRVKKSSVITREVIEKVTKSMMQKYDAVCLDIDGTVTLSDKIDEDMLNLFINLLKQKKAISFITGRGESSLDVLGDLYESMKINHIDPGLVSCIIRNGSRYYYSEIGFLDKNEEIVPEARVKDLIESRSLIRDMFFANISDDDITITNMEDLIHRSISHSGSGSLRFVLFPDEIINEYKLIANLTEVLDLLGFNDIFQISKGLHKGMTILEISPSDKQKAVRYFSETNDISEDKIIRVGDQGQLYGNDYTMLNCMQGFSVNEISAETEGVLPIMDDDGELVKDLEGTKRILSDIVLEQELD